MSDDVVALQARVKALELVIHHLVLVLSFDKESPHTALPFALNSAIDRARAHKALTDDELQALRRLADDLAGIPEEWPEFLKQLHRDFPSGI